MRTLKHLFERNVTWSEGIRDRDPAFFAALSQQQAPDYLWIGCADSRVPANQIVGLRPGELFVHRNVANVVVHTDLNCLSVLQYAVEVLQVEHVIVCGHYGCGGVKAALDDAEFGLIDNWLRNVQRVKHKHADALAGLDAPGQLRRLCELNVIEQVVNVCDTTVVRGAWKRGQDLHVHGWIYGLEDGLLRDLGFSVGRADDLAEQYDASLASLAEVAG